MEQAGRSETWLGELRRLHDENFAVEVDWEGHLGRLNARLGLSGEERFGLPMGLPPSWFVGDVEAVAPGQWVLVLSLNQARRDEDDAWHLEQRHTRQSYWDHWRWLNRDWWEPRFYRPLVRLASAGLGVEVDREQEAAFATERMVFVELCPYPSRRWGLSSEALADLAADDAGFREAAKARELLIAGAQPALVLVNGVAALDAARTVLGQQVDLQRRRYRSAVRATKELWHEEGRYSVGGRSVPVVGFPFLRKPSTHNAYLEIDQLGAAARSLVLG